MGGGKGGSGSDAGVMAAMASADMANKAYNIAEQQLQWSKDVWNQEQPLINASEQAQIQLAQVDIAGQSAMNQFAKQQMDLYNQYYKPLELSYVNQAENWASPANIDLVTGQAQAGIAEQAQAGLNTAAEQLMAYGVNPGAGRFAYLPAQANVMSGAAQAATGTTTAQNMKLQQLALEAGAINTGRGVANTAGQLTNAASGASQAGTGAASGAAGTAQSNLATGASAMTEPANYINAGTNAMNTYTNSVAALNNTNLGYAQLGAQSAMGVGAILGNLAGDIINPFKFAAKGGPITKFQEGGPANGQQPQQGLPVPEHGTPGGFVPFHASPSGGGEVDDVDAKLTAGEFVMPKDVSQWMGQKSLVTQIDKARQEMAVFGQRNDIGGETAEGAPSQNPQFVSRPGMQQATSPPPPQGQPQQGSPQGIPQQGMPMQPQMAQAPSGPRPAPMGVNQRSGIPMPV